MSLDLSPASTATSSHAAFSVTENGDEYSNDELQFVWDTVTRAEATLPTLPLTSRHPTNALFRAYGELLDERDVEPINGPKLDKLLFKIGGSRDGRTISEKFQAVMAKMNIAIQLDVDGATEDGYSHRSNESSDEPDHWGDSDMSHHTALEKNAAAFVRHGDKIRILHTLQTWQDIASALEIQTQLFVDARDEDLKAQYRNVLVAWHEIALEVDEMPLDDLPTNVYSPRIAKIALRTDEIKSTKNILNAWRYRAAKQRREQAISAPPRPIVSKNEEPDLFRDEPRLTRLAQLTYVNLSKSRALAQWSNRAAAEGEKADIAKKAHEMGLKAKALGLRLNPQLAALRQRLQDQAFAADQVNKSSQQPNVPPTTLDNPTHLPMPTSQVESDQPKNLDSPQEHAGQQRDNLSSPQEAVSLQSNSLPKATEAAAEHADDQPQVQGATSESLDEMDERTLLAKRHMMRMRVFSAWEEYTREHRSRVQTFATTKVVGPWRERSSGIVKANEVEWNRDSKRLLQWQHSGRQKELEEKASSYYRKLHLRTSVRGWRAAAAKGMASEEELHGMSDLADQYRRKHGTVQEWKARSRETAVRTSMKNDAVRSWREGHKGEQAREAQLGHIATRVGLYRIKEKGLPPWRQATKATVAKEQNLERYSTRVNFYTRTHEATCAWRAAAKEKRKARLREAYLETRRRVKKAMGARAVAKWHENSEARQEHISATAEEISQYCDWNAHSRALGIWRLRTSEKIEAEVERRALTEQKLLDNWRVQNDDRQQLHTEAEGHFQLRAKSKYVKDWKLGSLQLESRRNASEKHLNKERKQLKQSFEVWYAKTAARTAPAAEEEGFPITPGRPRLFMEPLQSVSTTPLAPVPQRQPWQARSKRNLRVSWAA